MQVIVFMVIMVVMLLLKGFFSGSEIALVNVDKVKLRHKANQGHKGSQLVLKLFAKPEKLLGTTLVGTNVSTVLFVSLGTALMIRLFGENGDLVAFLVYTPILLILGEIVPKSVYQQKSDEISPIIVYPLRACFIILFPVILLFSYIARIIASRAGIKKPQETALVVREQIQSMLEMSLNVSGVGVFDRARIRHAIRFSHTAVGEAMIPLAELVTIDSNKSTQDAIDSLRQEGYSRLPVYEKHETNIIGVVVLTTWDLMKRDLLNKPLNDLMRPVLYVSTHQPIEQVLPLLRQREERMAVVVDEFGSAIGIITMEDILEQVVGKINFYDYSERELRHRKRVIEQIDDDVYLIDSRVSISEVNELLGTDISAREFHTIGGLVMARLGHLAQEGESVVEKGYRFTVLEASQRTIVKLEVKQER